MSLAGHVTTNVPSCFGIVWIVALTRIISRESPVNVRDVTKILILDHFLRDVLAEFHYLFLYVSQKCIA